MAIPTNSSPKAALSKRQILQQVADALGVPIEAFYDDVAPQTSDQLEELLGLWAALKSEPDRQKVLALLRRLAKVHR